MKPPPIHYGRQSAACSTRGRALILTLNKSAVTCRRCRACTPSLKRADNEKLRAEARQWREENLEALKEDRA